MESMDVDLFNNFYKGKKVLITGHTGFKGSWLSIWLTQLGANVYGYSLPAEPTNCNYNVTGLDSKLTSLYDDILDKKKLQDFFLFYKPDIAFHLAAQPLVLESFENPSDTFNVNVQGTVNFLEAVKNCESVSAAVVISSDKCYHNNEWVWGYRENDPMGGNDPYSASKGCAELVTQSYINSFFKSNESCVVASARAGNVIGGGDWSENRIVPDFYRAVLNNKKIELRNPESTRPWQFVLEPLFGYLRLAEKLNQDISKFGYGWNFGPSEKSYSVQKLIDELVKLGGFSQSIITFGKSENVPHESKSLRLDVSKASQYLNWRPVLNFSQCVQFTNESYLKYSFEDRVNQIRNFVQIEKKR
ncbi:MAG: CDP-glucose 4,6-dehydratase [Bacteroidota bacterium]